MAIKTGDKLSPTTQDLLDIDEAFTAGGFGPLPGYIVSGTGSTLTVSAISLVLLRVPMAKHPEQDVDGRKIIDFSCTMSAVNLGHSHPKVTRAVLESIQSSKSTLLCFHIVLT